MRWPRHGKRFRFSPENEWKRLAILLARDDDNAALPGLIAR
jgi:hypothetical protein